jgi:aspartate carbamoyltransferase catalytic subunit
VCLIVCRTRVSFEAAMKNLGGDTIYISAAESSIQKGETLNDTVRCLSKTSDAIVIRESKKIQSSMAAKIINAGDGTNEHPTQTLVDLYVNFMFTKPCTNSLAGTQLDRRLERLVAFVWF